MHIKITSGSLEALKWLAAISMTIDHFNRFFFDSTIELAFDIGRLAMPLFSFIFAYNLARGEKLVGEAYFKSFKRLILFGILATPFYMAMRHLAQVWPLNIMFMLLTSALIFYLCEQAKFIYLIGAFFIFFIGGYFVEYNWNGILFCISCWFLCRRPSLLSVSFLLLSYILINQLNGNNWAWLSALFILLATQVEVKLPRIPYFFYIYYPGHLSFFWLISSLMR